MSRWLVTGAGGMLGRDVVSRLEYDGTTVLSLSRQELDVTDGTAVSKAVRGYRPDVVVNCAAWTAVDDAEAHEDEALRVNGLGARLVATACSAASARLIHLSTDYVFAGDGTRPYPENAAPAPATAYGRTKLAGERAVRESLPGAGYILRTAWLYGAHGPNFVRTMIRLERERAGVEVVTDQRGQPTWTMDVAAKVVALGRSRAAAGIYHATSSGETTWFGLAREVFALLGADPERVQPVTTGAYPRPAPRPAYSVLGHHAWAGTGIEPIAGWRERLREAFPVLAAAPGGRSPRTRPATGN